jgi:hypothetical protein
MHLALEYQPCHADRHFLAFGPQLIIEEDGR